MKYIILLLSAILMFSCNEPKDSEEISIVNEDSTTDTSENNTENNESDINDDSATSSSTETIYAIGYGEDGPCLQGGNVYIYPLNTSNLAQIGEYDRFQTTTINDFGKYEIPIDLDTSTYPYAEVFIDAMCHNEITGNIMQQKTLSGIVSWDSGESNNINPLTTIRTPIIRWLYNDASSSTYNDIDLSIDEAERLIISYFNMPSLNTRFTNMTLQEADVHDAVLVAANSALLSGKSEAEQNDFMSRISQDIINGTTTARTELLASLQNLPIAQIKTNLEARYLSLGHTLDTPKFWNIIDSDGDGIINENDSDSVVELLERTPTVKKVINNQIASNTAFDTNDNKFFAFPITIDSQTTFKYVIGNVSGDHISIRNNNDMGDADIHNDTVGSEIISADKIPQDFFDATLEDEDGTEYNIPNEFSAKIETTLEAGNYWIVMSCDDFCQPTTGSPTGLVPFSRNLHSVDGVTWVGHNQSAVFFRGNKLRIVFTD